TVREHEPQPAIPRRAQLVLQILHVRVPVHGRLALGDALGEANRINNGRVIELIRDDDVLLAKNRGAESFIRIPAATVGERSLAADQSRQCRLELAMNGERAADEAD